MNERLKTEYQDCNGVIISEGDILEYPKPIDEGYHTIKIELYNDKLMAYVNGMDEYWELKDIVNSKGICPYKIVTDVDEQASLQGGD